MCVCLFVCVYVCKRVCTCVNACARVLVGHLCVHVCRSVACVAPCVYLYYSLLSLSACLCTRVCTCVDVSFLCTYVDAYFTALSHTPCAGKQIFYCAFPHVLWGKARILVRQTWCLQPHNSKAYKQAPKSRTNMCALVPFWPYFALMPATNRPCNQRACQPGMLNAVEA